MGYTVSKEDPTSDIVVGGLSTELPLLFANLPLSTLCAATGIGLPVAFSFALLTAGYGYAPLEAFAAGAALSSTSLGTTLMALNSVTSGVQGGVTAEAGKPKTHRTSTRACINIPRILDGLAKRDSEVINSEIEPSTSRPRQHEK